MTQKIKSLFFLASVILLTGLLFCGQAYSQIRSKTTNKNDPDYISLGMYYFDAWYPKPGPGWPGPDPWMYNNGVRNIHINMRTDFPEREPFLGWYDQTEPGIVEQQVDWMINYGIDFIVFTFIYQAGYTYEQMIKQSAGLFKYLESPRRGEIDFAILWCYPGFPEDKDAWDRIVNYWLDNFLLRPEYKRIDGKPVIFLWRNFNNDALNAGFASAAEMLDRAKELARKRGINDLYFVICITPPTQGQYDEALITGVNAITTYNWPQSSDYSKSKPDYYWEITDFYKRPLGWQRFLNMPEVANGQIPFFLPLLAGYDTRAWGRDVECFSTPDEFEAHLIDGRDRILANPAQTMRTAVICAWNEHGEGSVVEPTKKLGFAYLNRIWNVFRNKKQLNAYEGAVIKFPVISKDGAENTGIMIIPARTFREDVKIDAKQHSALAPANSYIRELTHTNIGVLIDAQGKKPEKEIELRIPYNESDVTGMNEESLVISRYDEEKNIWVPLKSKVDSKNKQIIAYINHLSVYAIMGTANAVKAFDDVKYYPNPIQPSKGLNYAKMNFSNMSAGTRIKIYTILGQIVRELEADASGMAVWDGKNNAGAKAASGVYIVYMEDRKKKKKRIKVAVER
jgi:hypothetical protein